MSACKKAALCSGFSNNSSRYPRAPSVSLAQTKISPGLDVPDPGPYYGLQNSFPGFNRAALPITSSTLPDRARFPRTGITIFPGGFPLYRNGQLIGAIGISR